ncbi:MAG TPA: c-type cytochrome [Caulobacteraceae bacterium]|nr:c-type cytochrome [Caulobacteraceae bacterium]
MARQEPSHIEVTAATWLLHNSVPASAKSAVNPLGKHPDLASVAAGHDLFVQKCEICHAYEGGGKTELGSGEFPRPPVLRTLLPSMSDGEVFYHIRNGIRNTAMPAWSFPDRQVWQLVAYMRSLPVVASVSPGPIADKQDAAVRDAHYVGSATCGTCHQEIFARWSKTRMANVVRDPKSHSDAIIPDLAHADPMVKFTAKDIAFVYGSHWKQRYFKKAGDSYVPFPVQWDITNKKWSPYHVPDNGGDWWARFYPDPGDNSNRPTGPLCDGCHSVGFDIKTSTVAEWNVGCERCHGAGSAHAANPTRFNILNPARQNYVDASDSCIQCHSQGRPLKNPIGGKYYDWPVGYRAGLKLPDFWKLEDHKLGELTFTHFPDGTAHKNRMQGNDFVQSLMYTRGVTCFSCHDPHGSNNDAMLRKPINEVCLSCHGPNTQNGPHAVSIEAHTHHAAGTPGDQCVSCHMPKIEQTIGKVNVASHTFKFVPPIESDKLGVPNACNTCHQDKTTAWATAALVKWSDRSPWRMSQ